MMVLRAFSFLFLAVIFGVHGDGRFNLLTYPEYVKFTDTKIDIDSLEIPFVITNLFGLPTSYELKWDGLLEGNPFKRPKAVALISVFAQSLDESGFRYAKISYQTAKKSSGIDEMYINSKIEGITWENEPLLIETSLENQLLDIRSTYANQSCSLSLDSILDELETSDWLAKYNIGSLNLTSDVDLTFVGEMFSLSKVVNKLQQDVQITRGPSPDFYIFKTTGLRNLEGKTKLKDAWKLLNSVLSDVTQVYKELYNDNVVVAAVTFTSHPDSTVDLGRRLKQLTTAVPPTETPPVPSKYNIAPEFDAMYPVIFNIVLWLCIAFAVTLIWISWSIWHMDPGRDSVIYRMTTQRLKRD